MFRRRRFEPHEVSGVEEQLLCYSAIVPAAHAISTKEVSHFAGRVQNATQGRG